MHGTGIAIRPIHHCSNQCQDPDTTPDHIWQLLTPLEAEAVVNALRRWQSAYGPHPRAPNVSDPYVRLLLDRFLPPQVEQQLGKEPLDALMEDIIRVRTTVMDQALMKWAQEDGIRQLVIVASGLDTRAWRLKWPSGMKVFEIDSTVIQAQKYAALGDLQTSCSRVAVVGSALDMPEVLSRLPPLGYDSSAPCMWLVEDVVEYMLPTVAGQMFALMADASAPGSRLLASLSDPKLRDQMQQHGHAAPLINYHEAPGVVLNRILEAGWEAGMILSGQLDNAFDVDLHNCLCIAEGRKP